MYLKRLELYGFKSFHEKTVFEFNKGITAVVGPNGSGKSNIADAVRWVLGEQSAKSLRGQRMEDVIFSGTESRRGVAYAEVTLVLDNRDMVLDKSILGTEFGDEAAVSRRLYRSGESQYLINGIAVRLRDVHELFMDTGLGREGYSIIGQGRIEDVLSVKSEDRRAIFEEAAGIIKFKSRRDESLSKLERERRGFERACDIITEIEGQLEPLREQAERAKRYVSLMERLKAVKIDAYAMFLESHEEQEKRAGETIEGLVIELNRAEEAREAQKERALGVKLCLDKLNASIDENGAKRAEITARLQEIDSEIKLSGAHIEYIDESRGRVLADIESRKGAAAAHEAEGLRELDKLAALTEEIVNKDEEAQELKYALDTEITALSQREGDLERFNARHIESLQRITDVKARIEALGATYEELENRKENLGDDLAGLKEEYARRESDLEALRAEYDNTVRKSKTLEEDVWTFAERKSILEGEQDKLASVLVEKQKALAEKSSRRRILEDLEQSREGYQYSVKTVLEAAAKGKLRGVHGAVGDLIRTQAEYERAVEVALGGAITDIVVDDEDCAKKAIDHLKSIRGGRATFLPLTAVKPRDLGHMKDKLQSEPGIFGAGSDFVEAEGEYAGIVQNLLGRVLIAKDFDSAVGFSRKYQYGYKVVTLEGEVINQGGSIAGGSADRRSGILSRKRELEELKEAVALGEKQVDSQKAAFDELTAKLSQVANLLERAKAEHHGFMVRLASKETEISRENAALGELSRRLEELNRQDSELLSRLSSINTELREQKALQREFEEGISGLLSEIAGKQEGLVLLKKSRDGLSKRLNSLLVELSRLTESASQKEGLAARAEEAAFAALKEAENLESDLDRLMIEKEAKLATINVLREQRIEAEKDKAQAEEEGANLALEKAGLERSSADLAEGEQEAIRLESRLTLELERLNMKKDAVLAEAQRLHNEMWEEFNVTPRQALEAPRLGIPTHRLRQEESSLKNQLREMGGTVNVGAVEEYRLLMERHGFMTKQRDDITLAQERLMEIIAALNVQMEERFMERFAVISENFTAVFTEMFGGGMAFLRLTDEKDPLGSGIEIVARPPGKSLQNMNLLSGGERALCAIALLFGILRLKPSPFCLLDEIETALDDANVRRFARFLKTHASQVQFIIITHRKGTMEAADALYGVTMQEAGVSKLVGVKFEEEAV